MNRLSIVIPFYNEEASLDRLVERLDGAMGAVPDAVFEIVRVNDGSTDATLARLLELRPGARFSSWST